MAGVGVRNPEYGHKLHANSTQIRLCECNDRRMLYDLAPSVAVQTRNKRQFPGVLGVFEQILSLSAAEMAYRKAENTAAARFSR